MTTTARTREIRPISVADLLREGMPLFELHREECEPVPRRTIAPLAGAYEHLERAGNLIAFGAYADGELVGYVTLILHAHLHYGYRIATHDLLFVKQGARLSSLGLGLMLSAEQEAKRQGAEEIIWHCKPMTTLHDILGSKNLNYTLEELAYGRRL